VLDTYIAALDSYTSRIGGLYAPGIRGDDFIKSEIYSPEYTGAVFAGNRALFTPFDSEEYYGNEEADATQSEHIALLPVKMPYDEHWLKVYLGGATANKSLRMNTEYSLCVNEQSTQAVREKAEDFIEWLAADDESSDAIQLCLAGYHRKGAELPLFSYKEREVRGGISTLGEEIYDEVLKPMLSDPNWEPEEIPAFRDDIFAAWISGDGGGA
jgi:hypothetical protein